jgi:hypothetical protein
MPFIPLHSTDSQTSPEVAFKHHFSNNLSSHIVHPDTMIQGEEASVASAQFLRCRREPHVSASPAL